MIPLTKSDFATLSMLPLLALLNGCAEESDVPSQVHTLRVLAVQAATPFSRPGSSVELQMLAHDGSPRATLPDGSKRTTSTLWIGGCSNPPGDDYGACMPYLQQVVAQLSDSDLRNGSIPAGTPPGLLGWGSTFTAQIPADIITSRSRAPDVVYPYGVQMVFFAHCGGRLRHVGADPKTFVLGCFDSQTGQALGRDDFEYGFFPVFAYDSVENQNPILSSIALAGHPLGASCSTDAPCSDGYHCGSERLCIPIFCRCTEAGKDKCDEVPLSVEIPRSSVETAVAAHVAEADSIPETIWVSYYANAGSFKSSARIVNDPHSGWSDDTAGKWRASTDSQREVRLWAIVRDNRNGVAWAWRDVWVN